nr:helix-turn-helix domain-containing protein [Streptomyces qinglanensis]
MPESSGAHIGDRLREARKRRGPTQRALAGASGVPVSPIRKLEQQELRDTRMETARARAVAPRLPTSALLNHRDATEDADPGEPWAQVRAALTAPTARPPRRSGLLTGRARRDRRPGRTARRALRPAGGRGERTGARSLSAALRRRGGRGSRPSRSGPSAAASPGSATCPA